MAKRRRRKPNLSQAVLDQARQGTDGEPQIRPAQPQSTPDAAPATTSAAERRQRRRREVGAAQLQRRKDEGGLDAETVSDMLANPTRIVSEADLRADYGFVIKDLRNMGVLAAALFVALVIAALILL